MTQDLIANMQTLLINGRVIWTLCGGALFCLLLDSLWPKKLNTLISVVGILSLLLALVLAFQQWATADGLMSNEFLVLDRLTLFFLILVILIAVLTLFNSMGYLKLHQNLSAEFASLLLFSVVGMVFLFASDHLIMNFIGLETMSLAVYVLVGSHKSNIKSNEAAVKYFVLGSVASAILLFGIALFYGAFATFKLSELRHLVATPELSYLPKLALALILAGVFFKLALVPFHFWAPDVYQGAPAPVTGFMATGVKAAAFGFALRLFMELHVLDMPQIQHLLELVVVLTFVVGNFAALAQQDIKRMLAYSSISHAGFLLFGIVAGFQGGAYQPAASDVVLFYLFAYYFMTLGAFAVLSLMVQEREEATSYGDLSGLAHEHPVLAACFGLFMLSLLGLPGTVGFAAKYGVVSLAVKNGHITLAIVAVLVSVVSAFYYLRPVSVMFFDPKPRRSVVREIPLSLYFSMTFCAIAVIYLGIWPDAYLKLSQVAISALAQNMAVP